MAFVTSYERKTPGGVRCRVLSCYHGAKPDSDEPMESHAVWYSQTPDGHLPHVDDLWRMHCWGRRGKQLPICPAHRIASDADWLKENHDRPKVLRLR